MFKNHEYRVQRGLILRIADKAYSRAVAGKTISTTLHGMGHNILSGVLRSHCSYLEDKEYITVVKKDDDYFVKLTWQGVDFLEGTPATDPGVEL